MPEKAKKNRKKRSKLKKIIWTTVIVLFLVVSTGTYLFLDFVIQGLPSLQQLENPKTSLASKVYTNDGELLYRFFDQNRLEVEYKDIPKPLVDALIATEDQEFYDHWGVHTERVFKAVIKTIFFGKREGGSTITQQLAKNLYNLKKPDEHIFDTIVRKVREWITAVQIEKSYTKNEIIEMYLNTTFFGERAYGVDMASKAYFDKSLDSLSVQECAVLVALCKSSVYYNPYKHYESALLRRNLVMKNMSTAGYISKEMYDSLRTKPINLPNKRVSDEFMESIAPFFVEHIRRDLGDVADEYDFNLHQDGLTIYTTLDSRMQKIANKVVAEHVEYFQKKFDEDWKWSEHKDVLNYLLDKAVKAKHHYWALQTQEERRDYARKLKSNPAFVDSVQKANQEIEVGFVAVDVKTGEIRAMVGGRHMENGRGYNHVTDMKRQPGSVFKPFTYIVALQNGLYPAYPILNQKFVYTDGWSPDNYGNKYGGFMTLREGLKKSENVVAARLWLEGYAPVYQIAKVAEDMGIKSKFRTVPSITLGSGEVNPLEITSAYATIANKGIYNSPISVTLIEDKNGIIVDRFTPKTSEALTEETAFLIANMLESVVNDGTGLRVRRYFRRPAIGKTGTSQRASDTWFVGATPQIAAGVWVGFDAHRSINFECMGDVEGQASRAALPIWAKFMKEVYDSLEFEEADFELPESGEIARVDFCEESIYELGDPKLYSNDCNSGRLTDYINISYAPQFYNEDRDTTVRMFDKYLWSDTLSHEAIEITKGDSLYHEGF